MDILAGLAFSYLFERNQILLQLIYRRQPVQMHQLGNFTLNPKHRLNLLGRSGLSVLLATRLVGESQNRFHLATRIISRTHKLPEISLPTTAAPLRGHRYPVRSVAFHPWAPLLATGSSDNTVKLWRLSSDNSSATCVAILKGHSEYVTCVAFHPTGRGRIFNTFDAHRLLHWAHTVGAVQQKALKEGLFKAYFTDGESPASHAVLIKVAQSAGLDPVRAAGILDSDEFAMEVRESEQFYQSQGIHSVPAVIINDRHLISGGQPVEVFEQALRQIAQAGA